MQEREKIYIREVAVKGAKMAVIFFAGLAVKACRDLATLSWTEVL
jgi:hypothetical protein